MKLYTKEQFEDAKYKDLLPLKCDYCGKEFSRKKSDIYNSIYSGIQQDFCCKPCSNKHLTKFKQVSICPTCGKEVVGKKFCNNSCSATYNNTHRTSNSTKTNKTKVIQCKTCNCNVVVNIRASNIKCPSCKLKEKTQNKQCKICGNINCKREICKHLKYKFLDKLINHFGLNKDSVGTENIFVEVQRIKDIVYDKYIIQNGSNISLAREFGLNSPANFKDILKFFDIPRRSISAGLRLAFKVGRAHLPKSERLKYKTEWHKTWDGRIVFLRSSYESNFANQLDQQKIYYEVEKLRIPYVCIDGSIKTYVPDFYIPNQNKIVEIKSSYTYVLDKNIDLKLNEAKKIGYNVELIINGSLAQ